jgi:hypothetical protein
LGSVRQVVSVTKAVGNGLDMALSVRGWGRELAVPNSAEVLGGERDDVGGDSGKGLGNRSIAGLSGTGLDWLFGEGARKRSGFRLVHGGE